MTDQFEPLRFGDHSFSADELLSILDGIADGITVQDAAGRLIYANPAAARLTGFDSPVKLVATPPGEILRGFALYDETGMMLPPEQLPGRKALQGAREEARLVRFKVLASGEERWSMIKAQPVLDAEGKVRFAINIWQDVTDTMLRQTALEENTGQLEEVTAQLEATVDELERRTNEAEGARERAEYTSDRQRFLAEAGRLLSASLDYEATLTTIIGLAVPRIADWCALSLIDDRGQLKQLNIAHVDPAMLRFVRELRERYPPDDTTSWRVIRSGQSEIYPEISEELLRQSARDAEHLELLRRLQLRSAMIVPLKIRSEGLGVLTFVRSQGERQYDNDDLEFAESLAARSALAISNARLYKEAQEANRAKADFLAVMSHELRTPLTAIFGYTELLSTGVSGPVNENQITQLQRIRGSAAHLLTIIEDILSYARAEAGREEVHSEMARISEIVQEAVALVQPAAAKKQLRFEREVLRDCVLATDRGKVRQILVNLLGNAVKFTEAGMIKLSADCRNGTEAVFTVRDTGIGIAAEDQERIFEPFQQLQSATTRTAGGTGLGLAVTKRFAELLGGSVAVESQPGQGATFTVHLPLSAPAPL